MSDEYFTVERIAELINKYNWVLNPYGDLWLMHQKDKEYMKTKLFELTEAELGRIVRSTGVSVG